VDDFVEATDDSLDRWMTSFEKMDDFVGATDDFVG